jgi:small acid-soluble spore protein L (minor)
VKEIMTKNKNSNSDRNNDKGKKATSVTPQGYGDTEFAEEPKSKLEEIAKKKNTK